jgi:hypothetical protein
MKYKLFVLLLLIVYSIGGNSQISMTVQVPATGVMQKSQMWNIMLISNSQAAATVKITLTLLQASDNTPVLNADTKPFILTKGVKQLAYNELSPIQYEYLSPIFNVDRNPNGFMPIGNFIACYVLTTIAGEQQNVISEECIPLEIAPLSPPILNFPFDKDTITTGYPQFSWIPPSPIQLFTNLTYDVIVTEVQEGQSELQAIQQNIPIYTVGNIRQLTNAYPASNRQLDTAKLFAWRVVARSNNEFVAQSDVWTFRTTQAKKMITNPVFSNYILLQKGQESQGINTVEDGNIGIKYYSYDAASEVSFEFTTTEGEVLQKEFKKIKYGDNFLVYKLNRKFNSGQVYKIALIDNMGNKISAYFKVK